MNQHSNEELLRMEYATVKNERDSWRRNFEELKIKYEKLQNLFVETDDELNEYRNKFINEAIQHEYRKNDYEYMLKDMIKMKADIEVLKAKM
jgi:predicted  nucleic acid-binding Zn-ribbon protein